jgi:hypothetical protein
MARWAEDRFLYPFPTLSAVALAAEARLEVVKARAVLRPSGRGHGLVTCLQHGFGESTTRPARASCDIAVITALT